MPLFYNKVQRANPLKKDEPKKWYPVLKSVGMMEEKEVARKISDETTLNPKEAITKASFRQATDMVSAHKESQPVPDPETP